jgi:ribokinase
LNPAPAASLLDHAWSLIDVLTPNESELSELTGAPTDSIQDVESAAAMLLAKGVGEVVATLGRRGALWVHRGGSELVAAPAVRPLDTTGAGDAFNAGLVVGLSRGWSMHDAIVLGSRAGAFCVTRPGVIDGLATEDQLDREIPDLQERLVL